MGIFDRLFGRSDVTVTAKSEKKNDNGSGFEPGSREAPKDDTFKAYIPQFLYKPPFGYPLKKNVPVLKELAKNPFIFSIIRTLKDEASSCKWEIKLKKEYANIENYEKYDGKIKEVSNFFYNPNGNDESFNDIISQWVQDLCETDSAVGVKVFNRQGNFSQLFARDGSSFLKNPDIYGYMGNRADIIEPLQNFNYNIMSEENKNMYASEYQNKAAYYQYGWTGNALPIPFGKREIIYIMSNPRSDSIYGRSPLEIIEEVLMTLVYGIRYNLDYFLNGNMPDGLVHLAGADDKTAKAFQNRLKDKFKRKDSLGNESRIGHIYPVWGGPEANFVPFQVSNKDMEIVESQKWWTKLVWSAFGVTPDEMGYTEDSNKAVSQTQTSVHKRKALKPILNKIEYAINNNLMYELDEEGVLEFKFEDYDLDESLKLHDLYKKQVEIGIKSHYMVAEEEGINLDKLKEHEEDIRDKRLSMRDFINTNPNEENNNEYKENKLKANLSTDEIKELVDKKNLYTKYEVGDVVKIMNGSHAHTGKIGEVVKVYNNGEEYYYKIQVTEGFDLLFSENLKRVRGVVNTQEVLENQGTDDEEANVKSQIMAEDEEKETDVVDYFKKVKKDLLNKGDL